MSQKGAIEEGEKDRREGEKGTEKRWNRDERDVKKWRRVGR